MTTMSESSVIARYKDPLQVTETAYEILGVDCSVGRSEIETAFKRSFHKPGAVEARRVLLDGTRRARHDLILYDADALRALAPSPVLDESVLGRPHRASTVSLWERRFKRDFPNVALAHVLAVQWYWWAVLEEEHFFTLIKAVPPPMSVPPAALTRVRLLKELCADSFSECDPGNGRGCPHRECAWRQDCESSAPRLPQMWEKAIAYWCMVERAAGLGNRLTTLSSDAASALVTEFIDAMEHRLLDRTRELAACLGNGESCADGVAIDTERAASQVEPCSFPLLEDYRSLVLKLRMERRTAEAVSKAGVRTRHGKVCCGGLLLGAVNMLVAVRKQVQATLERAPADERLQDLHNALSPFSAIALHLESKEPRAALAAIDALPDQERATEDVTRLRVRALHLLGREFASLGETEQAVRTWGDALPLAEELGAGERLKSEITTTAFSEARRRQQSRRDEAIDLLDVALGLVQDQKLVAALADMLTERGINRFLRGRERAEGIPPEVQTLLNRANSAANRDDEDAAIQSLRQALATSPAARREDADSATGLAECRNGIADLERAANLGSSRAEEQLTAGRNVLAKVADDWRDRCRKNLAVCLGNKGIGSANKVVAELASAAKAHEAVAERLIASLSPSSGPFRCGYPGCFSTPQFTVTLRGETTVSLCSTHSEGLKTELASPKPDAAAIRKLRDAEDDLLEASELDPANEHVRKNLSSAQDLLKEFGVSTRRRSSRRQPAPKASRKGAQARRQRPRGDDDGKPTAVAAPAARPEKAASAVAATSRLAVACLVLGLLSVGLGPLTGLPALLCGHGALAKIRASDGAVQGRGMAGTGLAVAYAALVLWIAFIYRKTTGAG